MLGKIQYGICSKCPERRAIGGKVGFKTSEDGAVCKYPLELNADGKIIIGGAESGTFTKGAWYNVKLNLTPNITARSRNVRLLLRTAQNPVTGTATLSASNLMHARVEIMPEAMQQQRRPPYILTI